MHSTADIFVKSIDPTHSLEYFAQRTKEILGIVDFEKRESSNFHEGEYFRGLTQGFETTICYLDTKGLEVYEFWIILESKHLQLPTNFVQSTAQSLSTAGWECFVPTGPWAKQSWDQQGVSYHA